MRVCLYSTRQHHVKTFHTISVLAPRSEADSLLVLTETSLLAPAHATRTWQLCFQFRELSYRELVWRDSARCCFGLDKCVQKLALQVPGATLLIIHTVIWCAWLLHANVCTRIPTNLQHILSLKNLLYECMWQNYYTCINIQELGIQFLNRHLSIGINAGFTPFLFFLLEYNN